MPDLTPEFRLFPVEATLSIDERFLVPGWEAYTLQAVEREIEGLLADIRRDLLERVQGVFV